VHRDREFRFSSSTIDAMRDVLAHRGPDDAGSYLAPGVALGSRRLAILDLSEQGHMPMQSADGRYWITYNGEIYNYRDLRAELASRGHRFRSHTDTEVVLHLYQEQGPQMLERLNGMFAIAIWDAQERTLFLARDRVGVKPLYYTLENGTLYFASEQKALFAGGVRAEFDSDTWTELLCFGYVAGERTPFRGVLRLLPGHYLIWKAGRVETRRWWNLADRIRLHREAPPRDPLEWFRETFDSAVGLRRISDVPVGVLLSGGLDSSSIAASLAHQAGRGVSSFTVRFADRSHDEGPLASKVAERWQLDAHELVVADQDLLDGLDRASWLNDEPLAHQNALHVLAISRYAKPRVTVLLSGEGADETLGGYVRYRPLRSFRYPELMSVARGPIAAASWVARSHTRISKLRTLLSRGSPQALVLFNWCEVEPDDLHAVGVQTARQFPFREQVVDEARSLYGRDLVRQAMYSDQQTYLCSLLDRNDRMTMGSSIECRVPFLDYRLVEGAGALPTRQLFSPAKGKRVLRQALGSRLPPDILAHRKWGFSVPWDRYLRRHSSLRDLVSGLVDRDPIRGGPFDRAKLRTAISQFLSGDRRWDNLVRQLVMIDVWHRALQHAASHRHQEPTRFRPEGASLSA
jgi:asparagine synthase (glutamine-hydrolysing)